MSSDKLQRTQIADTRTLGAAVWLFSHSKLHKRLAIHGIHRWILPPLKHKQFMLYEIENKPCGFITWACLNDEAEKSYIECTKNLTPDRWKCGENIWLIDFVAPFGEGNAVLTDLRKNVFPNKKGKFIRARHGSPKVQVCHASGFITSDT